MKPAQPTVSSIRAGFPGPRADISLLPRARRAVQGHVRGRDVTLKPRSSSSVPQLMGASLTSGTNEPRRNLRLWEHRRLLSMGKEKDITETEKMENGSKDLAQEMIMRALPQAGSGLCSCRQPSPGFSLPCRNMVSGRDSRR